MKTKQIGSWVRHPLTCLAGAALAALLCGCFLQSTGLVIGAAILVLAAIGVVWPWIGLRGITCMVRFERRRAYEGEAVPVTITVTNRWPWPVWGLTLQNGFEVVDDATESPASAAIAKVRGWATTSFHWQFTPKCRGEYPIEQPSIATGFPFGLWHAKRTVHVENRLLVRPATFPLSSVPQTEGSDYTGSCLSEVRAGDAGDVLGVRPYRRGDSLRRIHWAHTARLGRLIVCERQSPTRPTAQIVLDAEATIHCGSGPDSSLQWATRIAASLCECFLQHSARVECCIGGKTISAASEARDFELVLDALARIPHSGLAATATAKKQHASIVSQHEIIVTTDRGLARWHSEDVCIGQRRFIVLRADSFVGEDCQPAAVLFPADHSSIHIENNENIPQHFRHQWERVSV
jgi:uncharacterized protein (DUF58 family)